MRVRLPRFLARLPKRICLPLSVTLVVAACASATTTPTPSVAPSPQASETAAASAIPIRPPLSYPPLTDSGPSATVIVDRLEVVDFLAVIDFPRNFNPQSAVDLGRGSEVLLTYGPLSAHGRDWYEVYFRWLPADLPYFTDVTFGWVSAGPAGQLPTNISIRPSRCPDAVTATVVGSMSSLARLQCLGKGPHEVAGVIHGCADPPIPGNPAWLFEECLNLVNPDGTPSNLFIFFPPGLDRARLAEGDVVRAVGHVDDPDALTCRPADPPVSEAERAELVLDCRTAFVLSEIEVIGQAEQRQ